LAGRRVAPGPSLAARGLNGLLSAGGAGRVAAWVLTLGLSHAVGYRCCCWARLRAGTTLAGWTAARWCGPGRAAGLGRATALVLVMGTCRTTAATCSFG
jgi:hypothetical protein